jgi:erythromycin esterase
MGNLRRHGIGRILAMFTLSMAFQPGATAEDAFESQVRSAAIALENADDLDPLLESAAGRRAVLLGESTHGTSEFYRWRKWITRRLIEEQGFRFLAVEGDWEAWHALRPYLEGDPSAPASAREALRGFQRWPGWLWANEETARLVEWMRAFNAGRVVGDRVYIYGLDLYGARTAWRELLDRIRTHDPDGVRQFEEDYEAIARHDGDLVAYARALAAGESSAASGTERALERVRAWVRDRPELDPVEAFHLEQLARVIRDAELHFRAMADETLNSWNKRADHFFVTFDRLLRRYGPDARGIVWAHNTHIGDARATPMSAAGRRNIGQWVRQEYGLDAVLLVGVTSARGRVIAAPIWGTAWRTKPMPPARPGSLEARLEGAGPDRYLLLFGAGSGWAPFQTWMDQRGIGVTYNPEQDHGYYLPAVPAARYDALIFFRETEPLRLLPGHPNP